MKPVIIVGGGVAGLAAAHVMRKADVPFLILEKEGTPGGRFDSIQGDGWLADTGCPYFKLTDRALLFLVREAGLEAQTVAIQDAIFLLRANGEIVSRPEGFGGNRVVLRGGMHSLFRAWMKVLPVLSETRVGAIRWQADEEHFIFRDQTTGKTLRHPLTGDRIEGSGVVLAVPGTEASRIAEGSRVLEPLAPMLASVRYNRRAVGIFKVPRVDAGWYAVEGEPEAELSWMGFEERKGPARVPEAFSLIVAAGGDDLSARCLREGKHAAAASMLYAACRRVVPHLPESPIESHSVFWTDARLQGPPIAGGLRNDDLTAPTGLPFAVAGDYTAGNRAEFAAESGFAAATRVLSLLEGLRART